MKGRISEVFESIQGEGIYLGSRQIFVRFHGCNLGCKFCDTKLDDYTEYESHELLDKIKSFHETFHSISFTGGEPLLQKDFLKEALFYTRCYGFNNYLETNGTLPDALGEVIDNVDIVAMDLKLPSSTAQGDFWDVHQRFMEIASRKEFFIKAVVCQDTSEEDIMRVAELINKTTHAPVVVLQPNAQEESLLSDKLIDFSRRLKKENITTCVIPQIHKMIGVK